MTRTRWLTVLSALLTVAMVAVVVVKLGQLDWGHVLALLPASPVFWLVFAATYLSVPVSDWAIFRRLWHLPVGGLAALLRKQVYNEIVLGYLGETYFYTWARRQKGLNEAPFAAVKDVTILSALSGNLFTLLLVGGLWPKLGRALLGFGTREVYLSLAVVMVIPLALLLVRRRVFSLPPRDLRFVFIVQMLRNAGRTALLALLWHLVLPDVELIWWLYLATLRQLVSRLPLVSNKDLIFAGLAVLLLGRQANISAVMAMTAALFVAAHLLVAAVLLKGELLQHLRDRITGRKESLGRPPAAP